MYSVKYDSTELVNSTYHLQYAKDQSAPPREFTLVPYASEDGAIIVYDRYGVKHIRVKGFISAATPAALQTAVDVFKELFSRRNKNLDITPDGGTLRRYVANCASHTLVGDYYNLTFLPYEADFIVVEGVGKATGYTTIVSTNLTSQSVGASFAIAVGSAPEQKLRSSFVFATPNSVAGIKVRTSSTVYDFDTSIIVTKSGGFSATDTLVIDANDKTVKYNTAEINYYGTFPKIVRGLDTVTFNIYSGEIEIENCRETGAGNQALVYGAQYIAQSFMVKHTDDTYRALQVYLEKVGSPPESLRIDIYADVDGAPSGASLADFTIIPANVTSHTTYTLYESADFSLTGNTKYWMVFKQVSDSGDVDNCYKVENYDTDPYSKGNYAVSVNSGVAWSDTFGVDIYFKLYFGGRNAGTYLTTYTLDYLPRYL